MVHVLKQIGLEMNNRLTPADLEATRSSPHEQKWRNRAKWARQNLVLEGFLKSDSPRGLWEITESGRRELDRLRSAAVVG